MTNYAARRRLEELQLPPEYRPRSTEKWKQESQRQLAGVSDRAVQRNLSNPKVRSSALWNGKIKPQTVSDYMTLFDIANSQGRLMRPYPEVEKSLLDFYDNNPDFFKWYETPEGERGEMPHVNLPPHAERLSVEEVRRLAAGDYEPSEYEQNLRAQQISEIRELVQRLFNGPKVKRKPVDQIRREQRQDKIDAAKVKGAKRRQRQAKRITRTPPAHSPSVTAATPPVTRGETTIQAPGQSTAASTPPATPSVTETRTEPPVGFETEDPANIGMPKAYGGKVIQPGSSPEGVWQPQGMDAPTTSIDWDANTSSKMSVEDVFRMATEKVESMQQPEPQPQPEAQTPVGSVSVGKFEPYKPYPDSAHVQMDNVMMKSSVGPVKKVADQYKPKTPQQHVQVKAPEPKAPTNRLEALRTGAASPESDQDYLDMLSSRDVQEFPKAARDSLAGWSVTTAGQKHFEDALNRSRRAQDRHVTTRSYRFLSALARRVARLSLHNTLYRRYPVKPIDVDDYTVSKLVDPTLSPPPVQHRMGYTPYTVQVEAYRLANEFSDLLKQNIGTQKPMRAAQVQQQQQTPMPSQAAVRSAMTPPTKQPAAPKQPVQQQAATRARTQSAGRTDDQMAAQKRQQQAAANRATQQAAQQRAANPNDPAMMPPPATPAQPARKRPASRRPQVASNQRQTGETRENLYARQDEGVPFREESPADISPEDWDRATEYFREHGSFPDDIKGVVPLDRPASKRPQVASGQRQTGETREDLQARQEAGVPFREEGPVYADKMAERVAAARAARAAAREAGQSAYSQSQQPATPQPTPQQPHVPNEVQARNERLAQLRAERAAARKAARESGAGRVRAVDQRRVRR
jgi:hypothetical protein